MQAVAVQSLGDPIPDSAHAVSVSLPSWSSNVGYEEGEKWVVDHMKNGYPRFFINLSIVCFQNDILQVFGKSGENVMLFPSTAIARRCCEFIAKYSKNQNIAQYSVCRIVDLVLLPKENGLEKSLSGQSVISAVFFNCKDEPTARKFWQHTGDGISSRRAVFFNQVFKEGHLTPREIDYPSSKERTISSVKGPRRYRKEDQHATGSLLSPSYEIEDESGDVDFLRFIEERLGRNLDVSLAAKAKAAIKRRISDSLRSTVDLETALLVTKSEGNGRQVANFTEDHVYLFPCGMSAIYNTHRIITAARGASNSIVFGFPYTDTLKVLEKFGPGVQFYGNGSQADLDDLEMRCKSGERFLALFCEFPSNPLLKCPDLSRIRALADQFDFVVVIDETIGNFLNVNVLPVADVVVSSLTKVFSGDSNVMGGSMVLNPTRKHFADIQFELKSLYADHLWLEDALFLERNSRDFVERNRRVNANAEALVQLLRCSPKVKHVNYPKDSESQKYYDEYRNTDGGYSGLLSITFHSTDDAVCFFDTLATAKGPSLGTNFTLSSPYVILAHYDELDWVQGLGVERDLVRVSVGVEPTGTLIKIFGEALDAVPRANA